MAMYESVHDMGQADAAQQSDGWQPDTTTPLSQIIGDAEGCMHHLCFVVGADALVTVIARGASVYELLVQLGTEQEIDKPESRQITGSYTIYVVQTSLNTLQDERGTVLLPGERHPFTHFSTDGLSELPAFDTGRPLHCFRITPPTLLDAANVQFNEELALTKVLRSADETCVELVFGEDDTHATLSHFGAVGITHTVYDAAHTDEQPAECEELQLTYAKMIVLPLGAVPQRPVPANTAPQQRAPPSAAQQRSALQQRAPPGSATRQPGRPPLGAMKKPPGAPQSTPGAALRPGRVARPDAVGPAAVSIENVTSITQDPALMAQTLAATRKLLIKDIVIPLRRVDVSEEQRTIARNSLAATSSNSLATSSTGKLPNAERLVVGPIRCQLCGESSSTLALYKEHVLLQHQNGCPLCSHKFQNKSRLLVHYPVCVRLKNEQVASRIKSYRERLTGQLDPVGTEPAEKRVRTSDLDAQYEYVEGTPKPAGVGVALAGSQRGPRSSVITRRQYVAQKQAQQTGIGTSSGDAVMDSSAVFVQANVVLVGPDGTPQPAGVGPYEFSEAAEMNVGSGTPQVPNANGTFTAALMDGSEATTSGGKQYVLLGEQIVELTGALTPGGDIKLNQSFNSGAKLSKGHNIEKVRGDYICKFCNRVCRNLIGLKSHITQGHREFYNKLLQYTLLKAQQIQLESGHPPAGAATLGGRTDPTSQQLVAVVDQQTGQLISTYETAEARLSVFSQDQIRAAFERVLNDVDIGSTQIMSDIKQEQMRSLAEYFSSPSELKELRAAQNASNSTEAMIMYRERIHQTADLLKHMPRQRSDCHRRGLWNVMDVERLMELIPNQLDDTAVEELPLRFKRQRFSVRNKPKVPAGRDAADENVPVLADDQNSTENEPVPSISGRQMEDAEGDVKPGGGAAENRSRSFGKTGIKFRGAPRDSTKMGGTAVTDSGAQNTGESGNDETLDVQVTDLADDSIGRAELSHGSPTEKQRRPVPSHDDYVARCRILDGRIECCECLQTFKHRGSLIKHRRRIHINKLRLICPQCSKAFAEKPAFEDHLNVHNNEFPHVCEVCHEAFATRNQLWTHSMRADHSNAAFAQRTAKHCDECGLTFKNQFYLQVHQNAVHQKSLLPGMTATPSNGAAAKMKTPLGSARRLPQTMSNKHLAENDTSNASEITVDDIDMALAGGDMKVKSKRGPSARAPAESRTDVAEEEAGGEAAGEGGEQVMYRCGVCDALFGAYDDVVAHQDEMQRAQDVEAGSAPQDPQQVQYLCKLCDLYFASECMANRHVRDNHP